MARKPTGQVVERHGRGGKTFALRFRAYGRREYVTLGSAAQGWTRKRAETELANVLADVRRGIWQPERAEVAEPQRPNPTFHEFATDWYAGVELGLSERTRVDYRWRLTSHLLPYFARHRLSAITVEEVDRYRRRKERERAALERRRDELLALPPEQRERLPRPLSNGSINKTIRLLGTILAQAQEYGHIDRNPAQGRKRLLREPKPARAYLQPDAVAALLDAAAELDEQAPRSGDSHRRRPLLATLTLAGLRISEALDLRWRDVSLAARRLTVVSAKTDAGVRDVELTPTLAELLTEYRQRTHHTAASNYVFPTGRGGRDSPSNVRRRFLAPAVERAGIERVTPHGLRRTFASLLLAAGADVPYVMAQLGHTDPKMTLGVYAKVIASKTDHGAALDGLVGASDWAQMGTNDGAGGAVGWRESGPGTTKPAQEAGFGESG